MAAVEITISGVLYDKYSRTTRPVVLIGEASYTGIGVGGGPIIPDPQPPNGGPPGIWGGGNVPMPNPPIANVPGAPGYNPPGGDHIWGGGNVPMPNPPIYLPPNVPPGLQPPTPPNPGDPTTPVPPPAGSAGWPVTNIVPPPYIVVVYPGVGPVVVAPPASAG